MSYGSTHLRRGRTHDMECSRSSARLRLAFQILSHTEAGPEWRKHDQTCERHPDRIAKIADAYRGRVCCSCGVDEDPVRWPAWVDDELLGTAYNLASAIVGKRGAFNRGRAAELKAGRNPTRNERPREESK